MVRIFERYLSDIGRERLLTACEETDLAERCQAGDEAARCRLVSANLRFVVSVARRYRGHGVSLADLVNEGNLGLVRAADRFDPARGVRFISYAHFWVRRAMIQAITSYHGRVPPNQPRPRSVSLDDPSPTGAGSLADLVPDESTPLPGSNLVRESLRSAVEASLVDLPPRERVVIRRYFGLGADGPASLTEIARELGVSRERTRQLKERALARLRGAAKRHGLEGFAEGSKTGLATRAQLPFRPRSTAVSSD